MPRLSQGIAWREKEKVLRDRGWNPEKQRQSCPAHFRRETARPIARHASNLAIALAPQKRAELMSPSLIPW